MSASTEPVAQGSTPLCCTYVADPNQHSPLCLCCAAPALRNLLAAKTWPVAQANTVVASSRPGYNKSRWQDSEPYIVVAKLHLSSQPVPNLTTPL